MRKTSDFKKLYTKLNWVGKMPLWKLVQIFAVVVGLYFTAIQIYDLRKVNAGQIALDITRDIYSEERYKNNPEIIRRIERDQPILKENGGPIEEQDLDNLLAEWGNVNNFRETGILPNDLVYSQFSFDIQKAHHNPEITQYIERIRAQYHEQLFNDFENIANWVDNQ